MSTSRIPAAIDALVTTFTTLLPSVQVVDGPLLRNEEPALLLVGGEVQEDEAAGASVAEFAWEQRWAGLGHSQRDETFEVPCQLRRWSGDLVAKTVRDLVFADLATIETSLRTTETLGFSGVFNLRAQVSGGRFWQAQTAKGFIASIPFTVNVEARI